MVKLTIYGSGCANCARLTENAEAAARDLGLEYEVEKVTSTDDIIDAGITRTPALAVDGTVKVMGKVPSADELKAVLQ